MIEMSGKTRKLHPECYGVGKVRIECCLCDAWYDGIDRVPDGWTHVVNVRTYERSIAPVPEDQDVNEYGDGLLDWQTHLGYCELCSFELGITDDEEYPARTRHSVQAKNNLG